MTETIGLNVGRFDALSFDEMMAVDGGSAAGDVLKATAGVLLIAWSPVIAVGVSMVGTPAAGVCTGLGALGLGLCLVGSATH